MNGKSNRWMQWQRLLNESYDVYQKTNKAIVSELKKQGVNASLCKKPASLHITPGY